MLHANLDFNIGGINPSGIGTTIYRVRKRYISDWPTIENDPDKNNTITESDLAKYSGDFVLAEGKYFQKIYSTQGKGSISAETIGDTDCKMFNNKLSCSFPDLTAAALGFAKASINDDYVYLAKSAGRWHVIGSPDYRSTTVATPNSGDAAGSTKGIVFDVECPDVSMLPVSEGDVALEDGTFDCSTGVFTPAS